MALLVALVSGAVAMRDWLGLRLAPVRVPHPTIEYLYAPNQESVRAGAPIRVNAYGMRSEPFPAQRTSTEELRVMVFGDSVLAAPGLTGQDQLATTLLQRRLAQELGRPVVVGNISTGSWGPANWLAYARAFGFFDADIILLVASGHDLVDHPQFLPMHPEPRPVPDLLVPLAEFASRQRLRVIDALASDPPAPSSAVAHSYPPLDPDLMRRGLDDLRAFLALALNQTARVRVLLHPEQPELQGALHPGRLQIAALAEQMAIPVLLPDERYRAAAAAGEGPFLDLIHPSDAGHRLLAGLLREEVVEALAGSQ
ncbi:MAG: SGNH/GDSL hydrolase family protein [Steroidobacteraceae bacterium]